MYDFKAEKPDIQPVERIYGLELKWHEPPATTEEYIKQDVDNLWQEVMFNRQLIINIVDFIYELPRKDEIEGHMIEKIADIKELVIRTLRSMDQSLKEYNDRRRSSDH